ncbi:thioredoxin superfamily protein [Actinidia rufa]|uniref:Thioredoxin superfamily protein n=1 Tax=Actinidia rufa TaxID=165716 RepID=A0A7J0DFT4_9ERIC|nr:thioredoxin superfamily protein [Actinidia rufa]
MQQQSASYYKASVSFGKIGEGKYDLRMHCIVPNSFPDRSLTKPGLKAKNLSIIKNCRIGRHEIWEFTTDEEFLKILEKAKETDSLVVVDFYRTSCGSCKYMEQIFSKLCTGSGDQDGSVFFLKHSVIDEYDEQSEVADRLRIKAVPLFHFYKNGVLLEAFPTRDKDRIVAAILKYTAPVSQDV